MCLCRISGAILEGRDKHMEVPSEAVVERPRTRIGACRGREVVLQRRREVVRVAVRACQQASSLPSQAQDVPEVEVLREVDLLEYVHPSKVPPPAFTASAPSMSRACPLLTPNYHPVCPSD